MRYAALAFLGLLLMAATISGQTAISGNLATHIDSIIGSLPTNQAGDMDAYVSPTASEQAQWRLIIQDMLDEDYASAHSQAGSLEYRVVAFTDTTTTPSDVYYVLERDTDATGHHWGTFVFNPAPTRSRLIIESPHPLDNVNTGQQGFLVFKVADALVFMVAGAHKCNSSAYSPCDGTSDACGSGSEPYRNGDQAHITDGTFQLTTEEILDIKPSAIVIQPHGYTQGTGDPDLIMGNGTQDAPTVEYLTALRDNLLLQDNTLTFKLAHIDTTWTLNIGLTNVQGRLVNGVSNPCSDYASLASGGFLHLEQAYAGLRDTEANWHKLAAAVAATFAPDNEIVSAQTGSWTSASTWVGGIVPTRDDDVLIAAGHTISVDDTEAECLSVTFGDTASHIDMNAGTQLSVYGNFTLFSAVHNVFSAGWSADNAKVRLTGSASVQTLSGWSTSGGSTSFRDLVIDKPVGTTVKTGGGGQRFAIQNSLEIIGGTFLLAADDDFEARFASSGNLTNNQNLTITVQADGEFRMEDGDGSHWVRSNTGSIPIGKMTVYGYVEFVDGSSSDISIKNIDIKNGATVELGSGLGSTTYGAYLNPGTVTVDSGGSIYNVATSDPWFDTSIVVLSPGAVYKTDASSTEFPPTFTNNGKVRYQRDPSGSTAQTVADMDYHDVEFSFDGGGHVKSWTLTAPHQVADSLTINNTATLVLSASAAQTLTVAQTLRLTTGLIDNSDADVTLQMADGAVISRATGTISNAPTFAGAVDLKYTSSTGSVTTGPEMPASSTALRDLTIYSSGQTVYLGRDITVNGDLTLSAGTFDNDGEENDYTMTMANGSSIRRATATLAAAPAFAGSVDLEYISTVSHVTTGLEVPTGTTTLTNLTITGDEGVTLGSNVTVNGTLTVNGSNLTTDTYTVTLANGASLVEGGTYEVDGSITTTRTLAQSATETFGGLGVELTATGAAPGATTVLRVTGQPQTIDGVLGISRYFDITPATNTGLAATMVFHYSDVELDGIAEDSMALYSSTNGGGTWTYRGGTVDPVANTVTLAGIGSFSRWTLGGVVLEGQAISAQSGSWTDPATWVGGAVPDATEDVLVVSGHTVSVDDTLAVAKSLRFGGDDANLDMNDFSRLTLYGDITLFSQSHNAFAGGWSPDSAYIRLAGSATQTLSGWSTTGGSSSFRDLIIEKDSGTVVQTAGGGMRLCVQNSLQIISGRLVLQPDDDFEARWTTSGNLTSDQNLAVTIHALGQFVQVDGDGSHFIRSGTGSAPIGPMTVAGLAEFTDAGSYDMSIAGITVTAGGQVTLGTGLGSTTYGPEFNPGTITVDSGGVLFNEGTSSLWFDTSKVILNRGGVYKTTSSTTPFPATFVNEGRVRYQRDPSSATTDQVIVDMNYRDIEFSFNGNSTKKLWTLTGNRLIADSVEINNSAEVIVSADAAQTLTVDSTLRLTSGSLNIGDPEVTLSLSNGALISRATGTISNAPSFAGVVDVRYTSSTTSVTTGPELPTAAGVLRDLTIYSPDQTVTLGENATVNRELTLSVGTFDNNGTSDDKVLTLADDAIIRRATAPLTAAPVFGSRVDVEYISTVAPVVTGAELPTAPGVLRDLTIGGNMGVTLGANVTVNGALHLADSILITDGFAVTLAPAATLVEDSIWVVQGTVQTTRTVGQGVAETFGGLGLTVTASGAAPGATTVRRVTGVAQAVGDSAGITRYFVATPAINTGLNATVVFRYADRELNGLTESSLTLYRSANGTAWEVVSGAVVDTLANTVTATGVNSLGWLTLGGPKSGCCQKMGNVDRSEDLLVTMGDLTVLIDHLFITLTPLVCNDEGNVDLSTDNLVTMGDLTVMIDHLFISLAPLPACP